MFYCKKCRKKRNYPQSLFRSQGPCEICRENVMCYDVPSKFLPPQKNDVREKQPYVRRGRAVICGIISVIVAVGVGFALPAKTGSWNWTAAATGFVAWVILFFAFCRRPDA